MTAIKGLGTMGNGVGVVTPLDHKLAQAGLLCKTTTPLGVRPGLFYNGTSTIVTGTAGMAYSVAAYQLATQRSATAGVVLGGNDGTVSVATTAAPGANSRYDVVYHWHREFSADGVDSNPVIGVVQGSASATPSVPSLAAFPGAIALATILVPAGVTATNAGTTITQTAPFTAVDGGIVPFRTKTEMDAWTSALIGQLARDLASQIVYRWNGAAWRAWESGWITYTAALTSLAVGAGGAASAVTKYRYVAGEVEVDLLFVLGNSGAAVGTNPTVALPMPVVTVAHPTVIYSGTASLFDASPGAMRPAIIVADTVANYIRLYMVTAGVTQAYDSITSGAPWAWAAGDAIHARFWVTPA